MTTMAANTRQRDVIVAGLVVALIGAVALVSELWPQLDRYVPLVIGLGLLVAFAVGRWYAALVAGSIVTGLGTGLVAAQLSGIPELDGAGAVLGLAGGFFAIMLISAIASLKQHHWWPVIPGSILLVVGTALLAEAAGASFAPWLLPAVIVALGIAIMAGGYVVARPRSA